jgi:hypothetical protein
MLCMYDKNQTHFSLLVLLNFFLLFLGNFFRRLWYATSLAISRFLAIAVLWFTRR